ncbi:uncharacterized protein LOC114362185 isoform X1 [Ostrinia furnacalis]|uniref:uncharacterized protein LOC114362185 isoform X1 n=1 Tax=Ostrinia furnacalis TaxID=93504 RepID=UPI00103FA14D|nr:uncharacterized protein LOC114362185 isoform X1 [Ostrinia furnacalis]XP_028173280.1 uncharacterized protein LOC114362185 isoform X1 [Ostrinia furnacalis]
MLLYLFFFFECMCLIFSSGGGWWSRWWWGWDGGVPGSAVGGGGGGVECEANEETPLLPAPPSPGQQRALRLRAEERGRRVEERARTAARLHKMRQSGRAFRPLHERPPERRQLSDAELRELQAAWRRAVESAERRLAAQINKF